jgi:hypothetical protein
VSNPVSRLERLFHTPNLDKDYKLVNCGWIESNYLHKGIHIPLLSIALPMSYNHNFYYNTIIPCYSVHVKHIWHYRVNYLKVYVPDCVLTTLVEQDRPLFDPDDASSKSDSPLLGNKRLYPIHIGQTYLS